MRYTNLHARLELPLIPCLPSLGRDGRGQYFNVDSLTAQNVPQPLSHVPLLRGNRKHLTAASLGELCFYLFKQTPFLRVNETFIEVRWFRNHESFAFSGLRVHAVTVKCAKAERAVGIEHKGVQART